MSTPCKICEKRRARRHCPGKEAEICAPCCGNEREVTIDCPSSCSYLREARLHEEPLPLREDQVPNLDVKLSEKFIRDNEALVYMLALALRRAMQEQNAVDADAREAIEAAIRTYRTLESGLIYETRPANPYAAAIQDKLRDAVEELRKGIAENKSLQSLPPLRDADVLGALVFLQRLELQYSNGRRRGRAFHDFLAGYVGGPKAPDTQSVIA